VITKSGSHVFHGSVFEFFRNEVLNANEFFLNQTAQPRPALKQSQFGFAAGGPIKKEKLLFFGSYQGTRQIKPCCWPVEDRLHRQLERAADNQ
jgi:hypothetical protein